MSLVLTPVAIVIFATPPREKQLRYPDKRLWENPAYRTAYKKKAYAIKKKRVVVGFFAGFTTTAIFITMAVGNSVHPDIGLNMQ